jgi:osmotically-inducible protein OsmY
MAIVTISRGSYTGGIAVAEQLARELQHPCVSREVVLEAAEDSGVKEHVLLSTLEEPPHFWEKTPGHIPAHLNLVRAALLRRAQAGDLVYHGYAGHLLLSGIPHVLRARIIAGPEKRIEALMEDYHMSRKEATAHLRKLDAQLSKWTRFLYGVEWQDPSLYDVVLNLDDISVDGAVSTLVQMTRLDDFQPTDASRKAFSDLYLSSAVWAALTKDPRTRASNIRVGADDGRVLITGVAPNRRTVDALQEVGQQVDGVGELDNQVGVGGDWRW